jgi:hypothetical protein
MIPPSIKSAEFKAKWAKVHLDTLKTRTRFFVEEEAQQPTSEDDPKTGEYVVTLFSTDPPVEAALIMGDFICALRAALDHLVWSMVAVHGKPSRDTCFPIRHDNSVEAHVAIAKATFGLPEEAITQIRYLQPYQRGDDYKITHLWRLHKLWNIDKHRFIAMHSVALRWDIPTHLPQPAINRLDDRVEMRFPSSAKEDMHLYPRPTIDIQFGDDKEGIVVTATDFTEMHRYIAEGVIPMFKGFFP